MEECIRLTVQVSAEVVLGLRPSGGPYRVGVHEDARHKTDAEFRVRLSLWDAETEETTEATVFLSQWRDALRVAAQQNVY